MIPWREDKVIYHTTQGRVTKVTVITKISAPPLVLIPCFDVALKLQACLNVAKQDVLS